jgi:glucose dehydrogenase
MPPDLIAAAVLILGLLWLLGLRGLVAFLVGLWLVSVLSPPAYALYVAVVRDPALMRVVVAVALGAAVAGAAVYRFIYNGLVQADFRRDVETAKAKRDKRLI